MSLSRDGIVVKARGLSASYGRVRVFEHLDLDVSGPVTALVGPNGAGKTTLMHLLCGLRRPTASSLEVLGIDMTRRSAVKMLAPDIGFLPQTFGYLQKYTVREFVTYAAWLKRVERTHVAARVEDALRRVKLLDEAGKPLSALSGGQLQRAGIAAACVHSPRLLVLDEPSVGLDPEQRAGFRQLIGDVSAHSAILLSTHLLEDVTAMCDRVVVLDRGRVRHQGSVASLLAEPAAGLSATALEQGYLTLLSRTDGL